MPSVRPLLLVCAIATAAACGPVPLGHAHGSPEALASAVLDALQRRDEARLRQLALDEHEFRRHVWPSLPAARPERNLPFSYVWGDLKQKSDLLLATALTRHGGRAYRLVEVRFAAVPVDYPGFRVHRATVLRVEAAGVSDEIRVSGSFIEKGGDWKVFSYVVDD